MLLAPNVVVHDPETNFAKINSNRLRENGWPQVAVESMNNPIPIPELEALESAADESEGPESTLPGSIVTPKEAR
jgi:hypothetical protein